MANEFLGSACLYLVPPVLTHRSNWLFNVCSGDPNLGPSGYVTVISPVPSVTVVVILRRGSGYKRTEIPPPKT